MAEEAGGAAWAAAAAEQGPKRAWGRRGGLPLSGSAGGGMVNVDSCEGSSGVLAAVAFEAAKAWIWLSCSAGSFHMGELANYMSMRAYAQLHNCP